MTVLYTLVVVAGALVLGAIYFSRLASGWTRSAFPPRKRKP